MDVPYLLRKWMSEQRPHEETAVLCLQQRKLHDLRRVRIIKTYF